LFLRNASGSPIRPDLLFSDYDERFEDVAPKWPAYEMDTQWYFSKGKKSLNSLQIIFLI